MEKTSNNKALIAHLSMFGACAGWGLMAPIGKDAMTHGFDGITMVTFRVAGACLLFWIASLFAPKENVPRRDKLMFIGAALFGLVCNQCCYTLGLSITSPINASIVTTSMPIFAMLLSALILKEPITGKKALGVLMGCSGALILILTSAAAVSDKVGDIRGDLLCLFAHRQQLIGETTHSRNHHNYRLSFGIDYIPKVEQTLDRSDRGTAKFHHFHCYQTIVFTYIT